MSEILIDVGARVIRRSGVDVHVAPKAFDLLLLLVRNQPNALSHQRLHAALWPGVHVSETSLAALITQLRKALGDTSGEGQLIRTLHRVGYAFTGHAVVVDSPAATGVSSCRLIWRGESTSLPAGTSIIGRDNSCAVRIDADSISRQHARIIVNDHDVSIEDLGSKNGTWVSGNRITGAIALMNGASFRLGIETVRLEMGYDKRSTQTV